PNSFACFNFVSLISTATTLLAPAEIAPRSALSPIPPSPTTATVFPSFILAVLTTAPTPVITAQPKSASFSNGIFFSTFIKEFLETTAYSEKADTPTWWLTLSSFECNRMPPLINVPAVFDCAPGSHKAGRPSIHGPQCPQLGTNTQTIWSPASKSVTPSPTSATTPEASCPMAIGIGRGLLPFITDKSEWQRLAALIRTNTSPYSGASNSNVSILIGRLSAYGDSAPISRNTADLTFILFNSLIVLYYTLI